jgi:hypothetical protein
MRIPGTGPGAPVSSSPPADPLHLVWSCPSAATDASYSLASTAAHTALCQEPSAPAPNASTSTAAADMGTAGGVAPTDRGSS